MIKRLLCYAHVQETTSPRKAEHLDHVVPICLSVLEVVFKRHLMCNAYVLFIIFIQDYLNH